MTDSVKLAARRRFRARHFLLLLAPLVFGIEGVNEGWMHLRRSAAEAVVRRAGPGPIPLVNDDHDADGIADTQEQQLAQRFAPIVILDRREHHNPASVRWLLARANVINSPAAALAALWPAFGTSPWHRVPIPARFGSTSPKDWTTYIHVYPRSDGGTNLQYWFFYPFNDGPAFFDHESDWEHITIHLDNNQRPVSVEMARHENHAPGVARPWRMMRRQGDHPVVLAALGTHASYASVDELPWFERASSCSNLDSCSSLVWRTFAAGGMVNVGERDRLLSMAHVLSYRGHWGALGLWPGTSAPVGLTENDGFCTNGYANCLAPLGPSSH